MNNWLVVSSVVITVAALVHTPAEAQSPSKNPDLRVLIVGSETGHPYPQTMPVLCQFLLNAGMNVNLTYDLARLAKPETARDYDVIVMNCRYPERNEPVEKVLSDWVESGKGLVVIHIASNSFGGSEEWKKLVGRVWGKGSGHPPYGPFKVKVVDAQHPIMQGIPADFTIEDEMYQKLIVAEGAQEHVLATATDGQRTDPMATVLEHGKGRVFHTTLGHGPVCHKSPVFQKLVIQGIEWTARLR